MLLIKNLFGYRLSLGVIVLLLAFSFHAAKADEKVDELTARLFTSSQSRDIHPDCIIRVESQASFDNLQVSLIRAINEGRKRIEVRFSPENYIFKDDHLILRKMSCPDVSIRFIGNNSVLRPSGRILSTNHESTESLNFNYSYLTEDGKDISLWTPFYQTDSLIQVVNEKEKLCRIHLPSYNQEYRFSSDTYIQYTEWYYSRICKVDRISYSYAYFRVPELFKVRDNYNVNYDYRWHGIMPRYRFFDGNVDLKQLPIGARLIVEGRAGRFCRIEDSSFKRVSFEGFKVFGGKSDEMIFFVSNTVFEDYLLLYNNIFKGQRGKAAYICKASNVYIQKCLFRDQYSNVLVFDGYCVHSEIHNNSFENCGLGMSMSICTRCAGQDYLISGNTFKNFGYKAIAVGLGYNNNPLIHSRGIVEDNIIYYTDDYVNNMEQHGLIDSGAISIGTINENAIIRYNFINNIVGIGSNRGIYCDDGAKNFTLYANIVLNVANSRCLDARYDNKLENYDNKQIANVNKVIEYNIVNGGILIQGRPSDGNGCSIGNNILLYNTKGQSDCDVVINNVEVIEDDRQLQYKTTREQSVVVSRKTRRELRKLPFYNRIKHYIKVM